MVSYLLEELPVMLSGIIHQGIHYKTLLYPTSASKASSGSCMANDVFYLAHDIQTKTEFSGMKNEIIGCCPEELKSNNGVILLPIDDITKCPSVSPRLRKVG